MRMGIYPGMAKLPAFFHRKVRLSDYKIKRKCKKTERTFSYKILYFQKK